MLTLPLSHPHHHLAPQQVVQGPLTEFISRFRATVKFAMATERWNMLPIVHHASSTQTSAWKLEANLHFHINRQLPYPRVSSSFPVVLIKAVFTNFTNEPFIN